MVWEYDTEIFRKDNSEIPTLELKQYIDKSLLSNYQKLMQSKSWINCEANFSEVDDFLLNNWLERLFIERLERKSKTIEELLISSNNDWEAVLFKMLLKNFGLKVNGDSFLSLANSIDFSVIRKLQNNTLDIESLLFGQANLLKDDIEDAYSAELKSKYQFLKQKFRLNNQGVLPLQFFRLRPSNFPTIRLSQFASLYNMYQNVFSKIIDSNSKEEFYKLFNLSTSEFWKSHYTFAKASSATNKKLSKPFIDLLLINTIIPIKFAFAKQFGIGINNDVLNLIREIKSEDNSIVSKFQSLKPISKSALDSQALLQLKNNYCAKNKCLDCAVGNKLLTTS